MTALKYTGLIATIVSVFFVSLLILSGGHALTEDRCGTTTWDLTAGQYTDVGSVTVENDDLNLYIRYQLDYEGASFGALHVWVGDNLNELPRSGSKKNPGAPIPGKFPFTTERCSPDPTDEGCMYDSETNTFIIPFSAIYVAGWPEDNGCKPVELFVVTHAEVAIDNGDDTIDAETAFGGDIPGDGNRWWNYGKYVICCNVEPPGPEPCFTETAFAKGTHILAKNGKANPENLPHLGLTRDRWGWAINLETVGVEEPFEIWAGAGLNNTDNGELVGTLTVEWDGAKEAIVSYTLDAGYALEEVHIYASDLEPDTIAPGQYGFPLDGYDVGGVQMFTYTVPLVDGDKDGAVWLIAHAVVSTGQCE